MYDGEPPCNTCKFKIIKLLPENIDTERLFTFCINSGVIKPDHPINPDAVSRSAELLHIDKSAIVPLMTIILPEYHNAIRQIREPNNGAK